MKSSLFIILRRKRWLSFFNTFRSIHINTIMSSKCKRWGVLITVSIVMMTGYVFWDVVSPISTQLKAPINQGGLSWSSVEYGFYAGSYSIFNIFLLMLFFGGVILDKCGIRLTGFLATGAMLLGGILNYYALTFISPTITSKVWFTLFDLIPETLKLQVLVASLGFALFGMGCDITGITVSKIITKWFTGHELASAMGVQVAMARLGTASALSFSPLLAQQLGLSASVIAGCYVLLIGFVLFIFYIFVDHKADLFAAVRKVDSKEDDDQFHFSDFIKVVCNPIFWLIAMLCVCYYSSIRPFMKFATDLLVNSFSVKESTAGWIVSAIPYGTILLTPFFGSMYDRYGHGIRLMLVGCLLLMFAHLALTYPISHSAYYAFFIMLFIGIAFSMVPAALWPSIPKLVPLKQLGTAYSITYFIQNVGLMIVPVFVGKVIDRHTAIDGTINYTQPMLIFAALALGGAISALILLLMDNKHGLGLENRNINN